MNSIHSRLLVWLIGALLLAATPGEKATLMYGRFGWSSFPFDFEQRLYRWKLDLDKLTKQHEAEIDEALDAKTVELLEG